MGNSFRPEQGAGKGIRRKEAGAAGIMLLNREAGSRRLKISYAQDTAAQIPKAEGKTDCKIRAC